MMNELTEEERESICTGYYCCRRYTDGKFWTSHSLRCDKVRDTVIELIRAKRSR